MAVDVSTRDPAVGRCAVIIPVEDGVRTAGESWGDGVLVVSVGCPGCVCKGMTLNPACVIAEAATV